MQNSKDETWKTAARLWLLALERAGVDNWEGYDIAIDIFDELLKENDRTEQEIQDLKDALSKY